MVKHTIDAFIHFFDASLSLEEESRVGSLFLISDALHKLSLIRDRSLCESLIQTLLSRLRESQLDNGLWLDLATSADYYKLFNDRGIALRIALRVIEACINLGIRDSMFKSALDALLQLQAVEGYWGKTMRRASWDVELTARALRVLSGYLDGETLTRGLHHLKSWLISYLATGYSEQPWALAEVLMTLNELSCIPQETKERALGLLSKTQRTDGSWGVYESNKFLTMDILLNLSDIVGISSISSEVRRLASLRLKLKALIERQEMEWAKEIISEILRYPSPLEVRELNNKGRVIVKAMQWAFERSGYDDHMDALQIFLKALVERLAEEKPLTIADHARDLAELVLKLSPVLGARYKALGLLLRAFKKGEWKRDPPKIIRLSIESLPGVRPSAASYYLLALKLLRPFPMSGKRDLLFGPPVDRYLLLVLRRLGMIATPWHPKRWRQIVREVWNLAYELFPEDPSKLYSVSTIARRWCLSSTPCSRLTREGIYRCPFYSLCIGRLQLDGNSNPT